MDKTENKTIPLKTIHEKNTYIQNLTFPFSNFSEKTFSISANVVGNIVNTVNDFFIFPVISLRPTEILWDSVHFFNPFSADNEKCVNYLKRSIRTIFYSDMRKYGHVHYSISPKDSWMFRETKIDQKYVVEKINEWLNILNKNYENNENGKNKYPSKIQWIPSTTDKKSKTEKYDYGGKFLISLY